METHEFNLITGVPTIIGGLYGKEQRILTEQNGKSFQQKLYYLLASVTKKVGDVDIQSLSDKEREDFFKNMLSADRKKILIMTQRFSYDFDPYFIFTYKYVNSETQKEDQIVKRLDISGGFPETPLKKFDENILKGKTFSELKELQGDKLKELQDSIPDVQCSNYEEVLQYKTILIELPKTKIRVELTLIDGMGESIGGSTKKEDRSSHTALLMRQPRRLMAKPEEENNGHYNKINITKAELDKLPVMDIEYMRKAVQIFEPRVDTEFRFEAPDGDTTAEGRYVVSDVLHQLSFFYPSETT